MKQTDSNNIAAIMMMKFRKKN